MLSETTIADYERITGETFQYSPELAIKTTPNGEFMLWKLAIHEGTPYFWIDQTFAKSFSVFAEFICEVCTAAEIEWIVTATTRNPKSHIRKWHMERLQEHDYVFEGRFYYVLKGHINNLK